MFSITNQLVRLFGLIQNYYESTAEVHCALNSDTLPNENELLAFVSSIPITDKVSITIKDRADDKCKISNTALWLDAYRVYKDERIDENCFSILVTLEKTYDPNYGLYVYSSQYFIAFLKEQKIRDLLNIFTGLFHQNYSCIRFTVLENNLSLYSDHIAFCDAHTTWPIGCTNRTELCKRCEDASSFLDHHTVRLIPQDFRIVASDNQCEELSALFHRIESILAYAYVSTSAYILDGRMVFYIEPGYACELMLDTFTPNGCIVDIYHWAYSNENAMERASIARNVLKMYCKSTDQVLNVDPSIFLSIKSNYNIYQKDTTKKYIELKGKISDFIMSLTAQMHELFHGLVDGIRNNFIAIVTFVITVLLTNSLTGEELLENGLSDNMLFVSYIFVAVTVVYWLATLVAAIAKWRLIKQSYDDLKNNYKDVLDDKDLSAAFSEDAALKSAKKKVIRFSIYISIIWIIFIIVMVVILFKFSFKTITIDLPRGPYHKADIRFLSGWFC